MKLLGIELKNIGLYKNQHYKVNFADSKSSYIFWGNNGAGKTTLLNSIKYGLLGERAYKGSYEEYINFVDNSMISARLTKKRNASISIDLQIEENNELVEYKLVRTWKVENDILEENVEIFDSNDLKIDFIKEEEILNKINTMLPPSLLDVIIFDGENAISVLNNDEMPKLIKNTISAIFGMDVYSNLIKDLGLYLKNMNSISENNSDQLHLIELENDYKNALQNNKTLHRSLDELNKEIKQQTVLLKNDVKVLSKKTGVNFDELFEFKNSLAEIQLNKKQLDEEQKYINEEILPYKILEKQLKEVIRQIEFEKPYKVLKNIELLKNFFGNNEKACELINSLENLIDCNDSAALKINASESDEKVLKDLSDLLETYSKEKLLESYNDRNSIYNDIKDKISKASKIDDEYTQQLIKSIENRFNSIETIKNDAEKIINQTAESDIELNLSKDAYDKLKKELLVKKKESNSYLSVLSYKDALEEFYVQNIKDICESLNKEIYKDLRLIKFRNQSITKVEINPKTFEMKLFESEDKLIPSRLFSAGEKQILLGMVIRNCVKLSKMNTFFLFDTPVGRLDVNNRKVFTDEVILKVSDQVAVFATDSDYTKADYENIKDKFTDEVRISRNSKDQIILTKGSIYGGKK